MFYVAERLQKSVVFVERMSNRQVQGWVLWFGEKEAARAAPPDDGALDPKQMTKQQLRSMFK